MDKPDLNLRASVFVGNKHDMALSPKEFNEINEVLLDQFLSRRMMMNFKNASHAYWTELTWMPFITLPMSYALTRAPFLLFKRPSEMKIFAPFFSLTHILVIYWHCHRATPRHIYTKILADPTWDGQYIRNQLALSKPGLWSQLSRRLHKLGYSFPEMLEYQNGTEFSNGFMAPL